MATDDKISETVVEVINGSAEPEKVVEKVESGEKVEPVVKMDSEEKVEPIEKMESEEKVEPVKNEDPVFKASWVEANGGTNPTLSLSEREEFLVMKAVLGSREGKALYLDYLEGEKGRSARFIFL